MLCYQKIGNPEALPLLFLHGFLGSKEDWLPLLPFFQDHYCCFLFDLPGHGNSPLNMELFATIQSLHLEDAPVIGYSLGGRLALSLPEKTPLILLGAHLGLQSEEEKAARMEADRLWKEKIEQMPFSLFLSHWYAQPLFASLHKRPLLYKKILLQRLKYPPKQAAEALCKFSLGLQTRRETFSSPALYLFGEEDLPFAKQTSTLPSSLQIQTIERSGHVLHYENPTSLAYAINCFLSSFHPPA